MSAARSDGQRWLVLEIPPDALVRAIAEEAAINDRDLDELEHRLATPDLDPGEAAAFALAIGRAGRPSSGSALVAARASLLARGRPDEADAVSVAMELLQRRPSPAVERAERGYRRFDAIRSDELLIEDPLAAHWHARGRWGPPLRPEPDARVVVTGDRGGVEPLVSAIREGSIVLVYFRPAIVEPPSAPLYLVAAGFSRDVSLEPLVRWSELASAGIVERGRTLLAGYERAGAPVATFPARPSLPVEDLVQLVGRLLERARS